MPENNEHVFYGGDCVNILTGKYKGFRGIVEKWQHDNLYTVSVKPALEDKEIVLNGFEMELHWRNPMTIWREVNKKK